MIAPNITIPFATADLNSPIHTIKAEITHGLFYSHERYEKPVHWEFEDSAEFHYLPNFPEPCIQLTYYLVENSSFTKKIPSDANECFDLIRIRFTASYLEPFQGKASTSAFTTDIIEFKSVTDMVQSLQLCHKTQQCLHLLRDCNTLHSMERILIQAQSQMLLLYAIEDCIPNEVDPHLVCKFLSNEVDGPKIMQAKEILLANLNNPITIKELSRKVALNECYLKKGFKEMMGCTIFEFYQRERMQYARTLLNERGLNVTEVAGLLGYSSISHFSTAFKKQTGLKPCELLWR